MKRIYTRTGDSGTTALHGGSRVPKTHPRIEANGALDELNTAIGILRSFLPGGHPQMLPLRSLQLTLMTVMSRVATPPSRLPLNPNALPERLVADTEEWIDRLTLEAGPSEWFLLPGGTPAAAFMHQARVAARRAERRLWALCEAEPGPLPAVEPEIIQFINRLSDLFFVMARAEAASAGADDERWKSFTYKKKQ